MINRKRGAIIMRYAAVAILFLPYYVIIYATKINRRLHNNTYNWVVRKLDDISDWIDAWEKNTPENTMELLKKDYKK